MSDAAMAVQLALVSALRASPALAGVGVFDGPSPRAPFPYISVADGLVTDWSTKTELGRDIRIALTIWDDGEEPARLHALMHNVGAAVAGLPRDLDGWRVASIAFLRSLVARDPAGPWAGLVEHRVRVLETALA